MYTTMKAIKKVNQPFFIFYFIYYFTLCKRLKESKRPEVSKTLLNIIAMIWIVSILTLISSLNTLFHRCLRIVSSAPTKIGTIDTFHVPQYFCCLERSRYFPVFRFLKKIIQWSAGMAKLI